jgi:hypothetical protein
MRRFTPREIALLREMAGVGHSGVAIARALDRTPQAIRVKAVELGVKLRPERLDQKTRIILSPATRTALATAADRRGIPVVKLANLILKIIARDDLVAAILDDAQQRRPAPARLQFSERELIEAIEAEMARRRGPVVRSGRAASPGMGPDR